MDYATSWAVGIGVLWSGETRGWEGQAATDVEEPYLYSFLQKYIGCV